MAASYGQVAGESVKRHPSQRIDHVQLDSLAVFKIIKHCEDEHHTSPGEIAQGYLVGLVAEEERRLEISNCFPMAKVQGEEEEIAEVLANHQEEMLKKFRSVNIDYLLVGFYQTAPFGAPFNETMVESMFDYQSNIEDSVVITYDPVRTSQGLLSVKAYRLSPEAVQLCYKDFSPESVKKAGLTYERLFVELPVSIRNSHLGNIYLCEMALKQKRRAPKQHFLDLGTGGSLEKSLRQLMGHVDALNQETSRYNRYMVSRQKQDQLRENQLQKRRLENESRKAKGEPLLPEDDIAVKSNMQAPGRMESLLAAAEICAHVDYTVNVAAQNLGKLLMAGAVVEDKSGRERSTSNV